MKCNVCDKDMTDKEVIWNVELGTFELCTVCLDVALDAAYSDGFSRDDEDDRFVLLEDDYDPDGDYGKVIKEDVIDDYDR